MGVVSYLNSLNKKNVPSGLRLGNLTEKNLVILFYYVSSAKMIRTILKRPTLPLNHHILSLQSNSSAPVYSKLSAYDVSGSSLNSSPQE